MIKIPSKFSARFINEVFYPEYVAEKTLFAINYGECFDWAFYARLCWGKQVKLWSSANHAFVEVRNKFFDSEAVAGVRDWKKLKTCHDLGNLYADRFDDVNEFIEEWATPYHFRRLEKVFKGKVQR